MLFIYIYIECRCDKAELCAGVPFPLTDGKLAFQQEPDTFRRAETGSCSLS